MRFAKAEICKAACLMFITHHIRPATILLEKKNARFGYQTLVLSSIRIPLPQLNLLANHYYKWTNKYICKNNINSRFSKKRPRALIFEPATHGISPPEPTFWLYSLMDSKSKWGLWPVYPFIMSMHKHIRTNKLPKLRK